MELSERWIITAWHKEPFIEKKELVEFIIWQTEECPTTHKMHYQGYVEFKRKYKLNQVKSLFKDKAIRVKPAEKTRERNILYCAKSKTYTGKARYMYNGPDDIYNERGGVNLDDIIAIDEVIVPDNILEEAHRHFHNLPEKITFD